MGIKRNTEKNIESYAEKEKCFKAFFTSLSSDFYLPHYYLFQIHYPLQPYEHAKEEKNSSISFTENL